MMKKRTFLLALLLLSPCTFAYPPGTLVKLTEETKAYSPSDITRVIGKLPAGSQLKITGSLDQEFLTAKYKSMKQKKIIDVLIRKSDLNSAQIKEPRGSKTTTRSSISTSPKSGGSSYTKHQTKSSTKRAMAQSDKYELDGVNEAFGNTLLADDYLWDEKSTDIASRLGWPQESNTPRTQSYRLYASAGTQIFGARPYSLVLYSEEGMPTYMSMIFANKGDIFGGELKRQMKVDEDTIVAKLTQALGEGRKETFGQSNMSESVIRWDWRNHAFLLSAPKGEYVNLRIMHSGAADNEGKGVKINDLTLKKMLAERIDKRNNGDVVLKEIPMVDQGPKGYCVPATFERYLRFMEVPADMYALAMIGGTNEGGGTSVHGMVEASGNLALRYGRKMIELKDDVSIDNVKKYIDRGMPVMWVMYSGKSYNNAVNQYTKAKTDAGEAWGTQQKAAEEGARIMVDSSSGHICMITGYNEKFNEFAVSDSWGPRFAERWIPVEQAEANSHKNKPGYYKMSPFYAIRF